jgi:hypothetical protein
MGGSNPDGPAFLFIRIRNVYSSYNAIYIERQVAGKRVDRSLLKGESIELFRAAIRSPATRDPYERRLIYFLKAMKLPPDDFVSKAEKNPSSIEKKIISFISTERSRTQKRRNHTRYSR